VVVRRCHCTAHLSSMSATANAPNTQRAPPDDTKPRRANRSTKLSGKLKVLPEQPEPGPVPTKRALLAPAQGGEGSAATGDSDDDDGDGGPDEDETEDVDVRFLSCFRSHMCAHSHTTETPNPNSRRRTTRSRACPRELRGATLCCLRRKKPSLSLA
jgi:hypothetical protein